MIDNSLVQTAIAFVTLAGAGIGAYVSIIQRITRVETFVTLFSEKAAKILHSPDDHLGIDSLLNKYLDRYYELTVEEWKQLLHACEKIEADTKMSKGERTLAASLAAWIIAFSRHKLHLPPQR